MSASHCFDPTGRPTASPCAAPHSSPALERLAQKGGEITDPLQRRRDIDDAVALAGKMRPRARPRPVFRPLDQSSPDGIKRGIAQRADQMRLIHRNRLKRPCHKCPVTRMRVVDSR